MQLLKLLKLSSFIGLLTLSSVSYAELSCPDLNEMRHDVSQLADDVDASIGFTREEDEFLADVVDAVYIVADEENNRVLFHSASKMESAWKREDAVSYVDALDRVNDELDDIYYSEC
ncbi:hypothetical protein [Aliamphritea ceti]|uniref:hypothetical protein n=1 Tax=Aliamphritea ceti TaxID=1524258 RepID=UPI0021C4BE2A|nr:hypothetical protein [Aliamphritea ceti]